MWTYHRDAYQIVVAAGLTSNEADNLAPAFAAGKEQQVNLTRTIL
jgi:hypothetical protein